MYGRSFEDPDGHMWGVNWMDDGRRDRGAGRNGGCVIHAAADVSGFILRDATLRVAPQDEVFRASW